MISPTLSDVGHVTTCLSQEKTGQRSPRGKTTWEVGGAPNPAFWAHWEWLGQDQPATGWHQDPLRHAAGETGRDEPCPRATAAGYRQRQGLLLAPAAPLPGQRHMKVTGAAAY